MGIDVTYRRLNKGKWTRLKKDRKRAEAFLFTFLPGFDLDSLSDLVSNPAASKSRQAELLAAVKRAQNDRTRVDLEKDWHLNAGDGVPLTSGVVRLRCQWSEPN